MKFQLERIALFSDAVFAIAITLMIIEIKPPHLAHSDSFGHAFEKFSELIPTFVGTILSFFLIGTFWKKHHEVMRHMTAYNSKVIAINFVFLLSIALIPFSTAFVFENIEVRSPLPLLLYNINYIVATLASYRLFTYILNPANGMSDGQNAGEISFLKRETVFLICVYILVVILAFVNVSIAAIGYPLLAFENFFVRRNKKTA